MLNCSGAGAGAGWDHLRSNRGVLIPPPPSISTEPPSPAGSALDDDAINAAFPNLANFPVKDLGFLT
ncbi:MAG: hypothetical protein JNN08_25520 [Bryobacterales bacterium]|nr:hypothetical protein [Bryobacterales bacterium]